MNGRSQQHTAILSAVSPRPPSVLCGKLANGHRDIRNCSKMWKPASAGVISDVDVMPGWTFAGCHLHAIETDRAFFDASPMDI
jgi:hypothetical protein